MGLSSLRLDLVSLQKSKEMAARLGTKSSTNVRIDATQLVSPYDAGLTVTPEITAIQSSGEAQFAISERDVVYSRGQQALLHNERWQAIVWVLAIPTL